MQPRRQFLKTWATGLGAIPLVNLATPAWSQGEPRVTEDDPVAMALGYKHDAADVDLQKYPKRGTPEGASQYCDNCIQYKATEEAWGACAILPGKLVAAKGWCNVWVAIPG